MKKSLYILILFAFNISFAQPDLHVTSTENIYIYVDGNGFADVDGVAPLYVTKDINLAGENSYIYLRNEAQLLQGTITTNNSGIGKLSVYQRGTVSNFNYNYWCSPVGNTSANNNFNRNFVPNNNLYGRTGVSLTASTPAAFTTAHDGTANPFVISSRWLYTYSPAGNYTDWIILGQSGTTAYPGYGFTMKGVSGTSVNNPGNNQLYDFRGKPNTGQITVPVLAPIAGVPQNTLTGNPYPSALDMRDFFHLDPENAIALGTNGLQFWEQNSSSHYLDEYVGGYGIYTIDASGVVGYIAAPFSMYDGAGNEVGGVGGPSPHNTPGVDAPGRYLPVGQGFLVEGASNGNMVFRNTYRKYYKESSGQSHFFRNNESTNNDDETVNVDNGNELPDDYMRFRIIFDIENNGEFFSRELLVNMVDYATDEFDYGMEAKLPKVLPNDAYIPFNNTIPFGIFAVPFSLERTIPLTAVIQNQQKIRFRAYGLRNFPDDVPLYLHDIEAEVYVNLRIQPYEINLTPGTYANRFEITFRDDSALNTPEVTIADFKIFQDNPQAQLTILNPKGVEIKSVQMYDTAGKQIFNVRNLKMDSEYHFTTKTLSEGVYVATITLGNSQIISKKVVVKN